MILRKLSEEWGAYQLRQVKTLYNQMITAEKSIHGHKENLLKKIERLKEIPHYNEPGRIRTIRLSFLKLIEGRKIVLPQVQVQFSPTLQAKIKDLQNLVKRKLGMTQNENVFLEHVFRDQRFIVRIKNSEIRDMSFIVALMHPSILKLKIDKKDISEVALPNEQIEQWLGTPGKVAALLFKDKSNHRLLSLTYKYPTHESLGLKYWE